jgi:hypothetical protein
MHLLALAVLHLLWIWSSSGQLSLEIGKCQLDRLDSTWSSIYLPAFLTFVFFGS